MLTTNCTKCGIEIKKALSEVRKSKTNLFFCSRSCAATYNNKVYPKRRLNKVSCKKCGKSVKRESYKDKRTICNNCNTQFQDWSKVTLKEVVEKRKYQKYSRIRDLSRRTYLKSNRPTVCYNCKYDKHIEVCHIKDIYTFDEQTVITEINSLNNLIALCPNCHWEFDKGILQIDIEKYLIEMKKLDDL